jgi:hypothetical protein
MPQADPAERVVDRRELGPDAAAALQRPSAARRVSGLTSSGPALRGRPHTAEQRHRWRPQRGRRATARRPHPLHELIAADGHTAKRHADRAALLERAIRRRRSKEIGAGMTTSRLPQWILSNYEG